MEVALHILKNIKNVGCKLLFLTVFVILISAHVFPVSVFSPVCSDFCLLCFCLPSTVMAPICFTCVSLTGIFEPSLLLSDCLCCPCVQPLSLSLFNGLLYLTGLYLYFFTLYFSLSALSTYCILTTAGSQIKELILWT